MCDNNDGLCKRCIDEVDTPRNIILFDCCESCLMIPDPIPEYVDPDIAEDDLYWKQRNEEKLKKNLKQTGVKFVFLTIQDFKRRIGDLELLEQFINRIQYLWVEAKFCIESGKVPLPDSNLHIHILGRMENSRKCKSKMNLEWCKLFDTNLKDSDYWFVKQHRDVAGMPPYDQWYQEKLDYFDNELKGTHENVIDLASRGEWGP